MGKEKIKQSEKAESDKPIFKGKEAEEFTARWNSIGSGSASTPYSAVQSWLEEIGTVH